MCVPFIKIKRTSKAIWSWNVLSRDVLGYLLCNIFTSKRKATLGRGNAISGFYTEGKKYSVAREVQKIELCDPKDWMDLHPDFPCGFEQEKL